MVKFTSPSWAIANRCSTVLVDPPMAISRAMAFSKASKVAMPRGKAVSSASPYQRAAKSTMRRPACSNSVRRRACVARTEPLPGRASPRASARQFIEFAVNIPEQDPHVGQAERSSCATSASLRRASEAPTIAETRSVFCSPSERITLPASMGPPETKSAGMFNRIAAISIPGVILSQLEMHTMASTQWALTMYSTESAMISRLGSEYSIPSCPMAMPSSTAMVFISLATPPAVSISCATSCPISFKCT